MDLLNKIGSACVLSACVGAAFGVDMLAVNVEKGEYIPESIAHPDLLVQHSLASRMLNLMPAEHRDAIIAAGGFGAEALHHDCQGDHAHAHKPIDVTPRQYAEAIYTDDLAARMTEGQKNIFWAIVDTLETNVQPPALCFSPDVDPAVAYAINQLIEFPLTIRFQQTNRWSSTATNGGGLGQGTPTTLTYSFIPDGTSVTNLNIGLGSGPSQLFAWLNGIYGSPAVWQGLFDQVFDRWSELIGVTYVFESNDDGVATNNSPGVLGVRGDVRIGAFDFQNDGNGGVLAYNNFPNDGDMIFDAFDTFYNNTGGNSIRFRNVIAHEHGHGLGMLHVCPANQTKLMEPFVSTAYDGPQLDDILNGQRHYGDKLEPASDTPGAAPSLGAIGVLDFGSLSNVSIDDNADTDWYRVTVSEPLQLVVNVAPDAGTYLQAPQDSACNTGTSTNYSIIHDLRVDLFSTSNTTTPLATANDTGAGGSEELVFDAEASGTYLVRITGGSTNSIQRYVLNYGGLELPFLGPQIVAFPPTQVDPGVATPFTVAIDAREDTIVGTPLLFYRLNGGSYQSTPLTNNGGGNFTATLPAASCGDAPQFYISAVGQTQGTVTLPENGAANPFTAIVGDLVVDFADDFNTNQGWTVSGPVANQAAGRWERGVPQGDGSRGDAPDDFDGSGQCYLTGNGGPGSNTDVDGGQTILTSPAIDLSGSSEAVVSYARWYDNTGSGSGAAPGADVFTVQISNNNGSTWTNLEVVGPNTAESSGGWFTASFRVADFVAPTAQVRVRFIAEDAGDGSVVEAAVDAFEVSGLSCEDPQTCPADLAEPFGVLNIFDIQAYIGLYNAQDPSADLAAPFGQFNIFDLQAFINLYNAGCP